MDKRRDHLTTKKTYLDCSSVGTFIPLLHINNLLNNQMEDKLVSKHILDASQYEGKGKWKGVIQPNPV